MTVSRNLEIGKSIYPLFALREVPQDSSLFSPFELLYGHTVRDPVFILHHYWTDDKQSETVKSTYQYMIDLANKIDLSCQIAAENTQLSKR